MFSVTAYIVVWALLWALLLAACAFALLRGGPPERGGAVVVLAVTVASSFVDITAPEDVFLVARLIAEGVAAVGFLLIAIKYGSIWLGGVMLLQACQFSLHAFYFVTERTHDTLYVTINNANFLGILACLTAGTLVSRRRHRLALREAESTPPETL